MAGDFIVDYQKQEQNIRRLAQMLQAIASMPEQNKRQVEPTSHFEKCVLG